ncbi:MAG: hypothetical protein IJ889_00275 [Eubacterium sp.]|nr:hypothetical protein [Eubacterium sp.]MBR2247289.1 hypothetical protein [Bacilli bacterium]
MKNIIMYNGRDQAKLIRDLQDIVIVKFRNLLKEKGYNTTTTTFPYGALPPYKNNLNVIITVKNPDAKLRCMLRRYNLEQNTRRNYYYKNEWVESSKDKDLTIHLHTYSDVYRLNVLLAKEA